MRHAPGNHRWTEEIASGMAADQAECAVESERYALVYHGSGLYGTSALATVRSALKTSTTKPIIFPMIFIESINRQLRAIAGNSG